jgi:CheY-like chemotaxis protein
MTAKRVLSVGQCLADHSGLARTLRQAFGAEVVAAAGADEALGRLRRERFALVLVNRVFDADGASGLELIRRISAEEGLAPPPVLLISNYDDAQRAAVEAGAAPGFGKAELGRPEMLARVGEYLK